jgi:hypothetical protein
MYMQESFLTKTWNTTPDALMATGVNFRVSGQSKTKAKKFTLFQVHEYVKNTGGMSAKAADAAAHTEIDRIRKTRENFNYLKSGGYSGGYGGFDGGGFCPFQCCDP